MAGKVHRLRTLDTGESLLASADVTINAMEDLEIDQGLSELIRKYSAAIDAAPADAEHIDLDALDDDCTDEQWYEVKEYVRGLEDKLARHKALKEIGPLLLAALNAAGATPSARAAMQRKKGFEDDGDDPVARLKTARAY